jgi:hypothetical protein
MSSNRTGFRSPFGKKHRQPPGVNTHRERHDQSSLSARSSHFSTPLEACPDYCRDDVPDWGILRSRGQSTKPQLTPQEGARKESPEVLHPHRCIQRFSRSAEKIIFSLYAPEQVLLGAPCPRWMYFRPGISPYSFGHAVSSGRSASGGCNTSSSGRSLT